MSIIQSILKSDQKPKEKIASLADALLQAPSLQTELIQVFKSGSIPDQGNILSALALVTEKDPAWVGDCLAFIFAEINHKAPRVKWEAATIVANIAPAFPNEVVLAIPALTANSKDPGTVVRWSAASALTSIARNNPDARPDLIIFFEEQLASEQNNGVRNIYVKALKALVKKKRK